MVPESGDMITIPRKQWEETKQSIEDMKKSNTTLWRVAKLMFAAGCLVFLGMIALIVYVSDSNDRLKSGRESRVGFQSDLLFVDCSLAEDDKQELPEDQAQELAEICDNYSTRAESLDTEDDR